MHQAITPSLPNRLLRLLATTTLIATSVVWGADPALAATFVVNSTADVVDLAPGDGLCDTGNTVGVDPECTLRAAIQEANFFPDSDTITLPSGTYTLTITGTGDDNAEKGDLDIIEDLTINGAGAATTIIQAGTTSSNGIDRVFQVKTGVVTITDVTVRHGQEGDGAGFLLTDTLTLEDVLLADNTAATRGGGVYVDGSAASLTLRRTVVSGGSAEDGGGVAVKDGTLVIEDSTFDGNTGTRRGGGLHSDTGAVTIDRSTFSGNSASSEGGGGIFNRGGGAVLNLTNSTLSGNSAGSGGGLFNEQTATLLNVTVTNNTASIVGGGIHVDAGTVSAKNTIVAGNAGGNCQNAVFSQGYNIEDTDTCSFNQAGDQTNIDPQLGPLQGNGGLTETHALPLGSPAIDAGDDTACVGPDNDTDQRGEPRPVDYQQDATGPFCDVGTYEAAAPASFTYLDEFNAVAFDGSDGTIDWSPTPWTEIGETTDPAAGLVRVAPNSFGGNQCLFGDCLRLGGYSSGNFGAERAVDLTGAGTATLTYTWGLDTGEGYYAVGVSPKVQVWDEGGGTWVTLHALPEGQEGPTDQTASWDISPYADANTKIRFITDITGDIQGFVYFDDIQIETDATPSSTYTISGTVFEDIAGDVLNDGVIGDANNPGAAGADVYLFEDTNGNGSREVGTDTLVAGPIQTDGSGNYSFGSLANDDYFVVVDSTTVGSSQDAGALQGDLWAEQTYGAAGSMCATGGGWADERVTAGPCYGGLADNSDNMTWPEHFTWARVAGADITNVDFGFSFNVVTSTGGGDTTDDDPGANRTVQGSLRQFVQNANAIAGANAMRFVPVEPTNATDGTNSWWRVATTTLLPSVTGDGTTIDGRAFDLADGSTLVDTNVAQIGAGMAVGTAGTYTTPKLDPELEIWNDRGTTVLSTGLVFEANNSVLRHISIWGFGDSAGTFDANVRFGTNFNTDPDFTGSIVELNVIGTGPASFTDPGAGSRSGRKNLTMRETDSAIVRDNLIGFAGGVGVDFNSATNNGTVLRNEVRRNGILDSVANPVGAWSSGDVIGNLITDNASGIFSSTTSLLQYLDNTITLNGWGTTRPYGIHINGSSTVVQRNVISDNYGAGVVVKDTITNSVITRNSFSGNGTGNGQIGIDLLKSGDDPLTAPYVTLNDDGDADFGANNLLNYPVLDTATVAGTDLVVTGWVKAGAGVELYIADPDPSGFGEGETWLVTMVEGSVDDTDSDPGSYGPGAINGLLQGTDTTTERFEFTVPIASLAAPVVPGDELTAMTFSFTTSEFSGNVTVARGAIVVNSTGNLGDSVLGDGVCDTGGTVGPDPECTLRAAIGHANATTGDDVIEFDIPIGDGGHSGGVWTITPSGSVLPPLATTITIDGTTQTGWTATPVVELAGNLLGGVDGFTITGDNVEIRSLAIGRFGDDGINVDAGASGTVIAGNHIGTDASGLLDRGNGGDGIDLGSGSGPTTVGGTDAADRNVISSNTDDGLLIFGSDGNTVIGNYFGTTVTGNAPLPNGRDGIAIGLTSSNNIIGQPGYGNVLSGNANDGLELDNDLTGNLIQGNMIGLGEDGTTLVPNGRHGIVLYNGVNNTQIGGSGVGEGNVISGNTESGVIIDAFGNAATTANTFEGNYIGTDVSGALEKGNGIHGIHFFSGANGNTISSNVISGNATDGVYIVGAGSDGNTVAGNYIGTNEAGNAPLPNGGSGVNINSASGNTIGGIDATARNVISGNAINGISSNFGVANTISANFIGTNAAGTAAVANAFSGVLLGSGATGNTVGGLTPGERNVISGNGSSGVIFSAADSNTVVGNYIGTNAAGSAPVPNTYGVRIAGASKTNTIGGTSSNHRNVISGNTTAGVSIVSAGTDSNVVSANYVGLDSLGADPVPNGRGVEIVSGAQLNVVGGTLAGERNVISANSGYGVNISDVGTDSNTVVGNYIGTDAAGTADLGNTSDGLAIKGGAQSNTVGGTTAAHRNIISGNNNDGVWITGSGTESNVVSANWIGYGSDGSALGNSYHGVAVENGAPNNLIGGAVPAEGNRIGHNLWDGVAVAGGSGAGNAIIGNSIVDNIGLGIDFENDGITPNDVIPGDGDTGPNGLLNFPEITSATESGGTVTLTGVFDVPVGDYRFEFFKNPSGADPSGNGEGETLVGSTPLTHTGFIGDEPWGAAFPGVAGDVITVTITECTDGSCTSFLSTSEFSPAFTVSSSNTAPVLDPVGAQSGAEGTLIGFTATASDSDVPANTLTFTLEDGAGSVPAGASITAGGVFTFTPSEAQGPGVYSFDVVVTDDGAGLLEDRETITVTVTEANIAPVLDPVGAQSGDEGTLIGFTATASDSDVPANTLTFTLEDGAGSVPAGASITAGGVFTFTPSEAQGPGVYSFDVVVTDDGAGLLEDRETITVTVTEANIAPVLDPVGAQSGDEGTLIGFTATASDSDVPANTLTFTLEDGAGSVPAGASITSGGAFTFTPSEAQGPGVYSFDVVVTDDGAGLLEDRETITVTVTEANIAPVLDPVGAQSGAEGTLIGFTATASDSDVPANTLTFTLEDGAGSVPAGASITSGGVFTWTPTEAQGPGVYSFDVVVTDDGAGLLEDRETITVTVNEVNVAPVLDPVGPQSGDEGTLITFTATASDSDVPANTLTFTLEDGAGSVPAGASITSGGAFTFTPSEAQGPGVYSFDVVVTDDGAGLLEDRETITVTVTEVNIAPVLDPVGAQSGDEGTLIGFTATATDSDLPVNTLTFSLEDGAGSVPAGAVITAGGVFTFTPSEAQGPGVYTFDVVVTDDGAGLLEDRETITVTVTEANIAPVLDPVGPQSGDEGTLITFTATGSDVDVPANTLTFTLEDGAGSVPAGAVITAGGVFTFTPSEAQGPGVYSFDVVVTDDGAGLLEDRETITVTVTEVNTAPVLDPVGPQSGDEGTLIGFTATATDSDLPVNTLTFSLEDGAGSVPAGAVITAGGAFTFTPTEAQGPGVYSFDVVVTDDGAGLLEDRETITVTVTEANIAPVLDPVGAQSGDEGTLIGFTATASDVDVPADGLTFSLEDGAGSVPAGASITSGGVFTWTPTEAQGPAVYSFDVVVTDDGAGLLFDRETITVTVNEVNVAPVLDPVGPQSGDEGTLITFTATGSDVDVPANTLTFTLEDGAGSVPAGAVITAGGVFTWTPTEAQGPGVYSFDVVVTDDGAGLLSDRETITVTVTEMNIAPVLDPVGAQSGDEGTLIGFTATATDTDVPGSFTFTLEDGAGSVPAGAIITAGGVFTFTPSEAQGPGVYSFDVVVTDNTLLEDRETITVTVTEANIAPVLDPVGPQSGDEGTLIGFTATASDVDVPADVLTFSLEDGLGSVPAGAVMTAGGVFTWTPTEAQGPGVYSFDVVVTDDGAGLLSDRETITVTVTEVNVAPVLDPVGPQSGDEGTLIGFTATATDTDLPVNTLTFSLEDGAGSVPAGAVITAGGAFTFTPTEAQGPGVYSFDVVVTDDGAGLLEDRETITVTVNEVNVAPVLDPVGNQTIDELALLFLAVTATDVDQPPNGLTFTLEDGAGSVPSGASITAGGAFTFTPSEAQGPGVYSFDVVVTDDGAGLLEDRETITVTVTEVNVAPVLDPVGAQSGAEGTLIGFTATASDVDVPAEVLTFSLEDGLGSVPAGAVITAGGVFTFTPTEAQGPDVYSFDVVVTDDGAGLLSDRETITVTVTEVNVAPVLDPVGAQSGDEGTLIGFTATATDTDVPGSFTFSLEDGLGSVPAGAVITAGGVFTFTPSEAQGPGVYSFDVVVTDNTLLEDRETITVTVTEANVAPVLDPVGPQSGDEGTLIGFTATATDADLPVNTLTFSLEDGLGSVPAGASITAGGAFTFTPTEAQGPGVYSFDVVVADDGAGLLEDRETITVTVTEVNVAPVLDPVGAQSGDEGTLIGFTATATDADLPVNTLTFSLEDGAGSVPAGASITAGGVFTFTPTEAQGPGVYSFEVVVTDDGAGLLSDRETITVTVTEVNVAPVLDPVGAQSGDEGTLIGFTATATDADLPVNTLTFSLEDGLGSVPAGAVITAGGVFTFTPTEAQGPGVYTFDVVVTDDGAGLLEDRETITVTVTEVNVAPVLDPVGAQSGAEGTLIGFTATASDVDVPADVLTFSLEDGLGSVPAGAVITAGGVFTFTPTEAQGPDVYSFDVVVTDDGAGFLSDRETITVTVTEVNVAPVLDPVGPQSGDEGTLIGFTATATDTDVPGSFTFSLEDGLGSVPAGAVITAGGAFTFTPSEAQGPGVYSFDVVVTDNTLLEDRETITVTVTETNVAPILNPLPNPTQSEDTFITFTAVATDSDLPANSLLYSLVGAPAGAIINPGSGAFGWIPTEAQGPGVYTFDVVVTDNGVPNLTDTDSVTITVTESNRDPVLDPIGPQSGDEGTGITFTATATDLDQPANGLVFSLAGEPAGASITGGGSFAWTPTEAQGSGLYSFDVIVTDDGIPAATDTETITVTVNEVNEAPVLDPIGAQSGDEGALIGFTATASDSDLPVNTLTFSLSGQPPGASMTAGGAFAWIPTESQGPGVYSFDVVVTDDGTPNWEDRETITVTVNEVNTPPTLNPVGDRSIDEGSLLIFSVTSSDSDVPSNRSYSLEDGSGAIPAGAAIDPVLGLFGWSTTEADGPGAFTFDVVVTDNTGLQDRETITVTVNEINQAPVLAAIGPQSGDEAIAISFTATAVDTDQPANTLAFSLSGEPAGAAISAGGAFTWMPTEAHGPGIYTFDVVVTDDGSPPLSHSETVTVTVTEVNSPPSLSPIGAKAVDEQSLLGFVVTGIDPDFPADTLTYSLIGAPAGATIEPATGAFAWTPTEAQGPGVYSFAVEVADSSGAVDSETIVITVAEVNDVPVIVDPGDQVGGEGVATTLALVGSDPDEPVNGLVWSATGLPTGLGIDPATGLISGVVAFGAAADSPFAVSVQLTDDGTPVSVGSVSFDWAIVVNTPPSTAPDFYEVAPGGTLTLGAPGLLGNDADADGDDLAATVVVPPSAGTLGLNPAGGFTYSHNGGDTSEDVFVYQASDGRDGLTLGTVKISILEPNLPPILSADLLVLLEDGFGSLSPLANDSDPNGDPLSLVEFDQPEVGLLVAGVDGSLLYTPPADFFGEVTASYTAADGNGGLATGVMTFLVEPVNDLPIGQLDVATLSAYLPFVLDVLSNDRDVEGDSLRLGSVLGVTVGDVGLNPDGTITYRPAVGFVGTDTFQYVLMDGAGGVDTVTVRITIPEEVLSAAIARGEDIGSPSLGFQAPDADLDDGSTITFGLVQGVSLLADAFFQSLGALQLPILFLGLALGTVLVLGGFTELPMLLAGRRRRFYSVVLLDREHRLAARAEPDPDESAVYFYEPTATGFQSLDKPRRENGRTWIPVESPNGAGWVEMDYLTETVDLQYFLDDAQPVAMLKQLARDLAGNRDVTALFGNRGLAVALGNDPEVISSDDLQDALTNRFATAESRQLWDDVLDPLGAALRAAEDLDTRSSHSRNALIPVELWNFQYLAINAEGHPPWLAYFEYVKGKPKIVGIGVDL